MVLLVLEQARGILMIEIPAWSMDSLGILESRVLAVPPVSVDSVDSVVSVVAVVSVVSVEFVVSVVTVISMISVESVVSNCLDRP